MSAAATLWRPLPRAAAERLADQARYDAAGLIAAVAQDADDGRVLMVAWMNRAALAETLATGRVCYWSRSRQKLWRKGETSGQAQAVVELRLDCDGDCVLVRVRQTGVACHTGRRSCFFQVAGADGWLAVESPLIAPETLYAGRGVQF